MHYAPARRRGFTISGVRNRLGETLHGGRGKDAVEAAMENPVDTILKYPRRIFGWWSLS
jgi:hypothetical protein